MSILKRLFKKAQNQVEKKGGRVSTVEKKLLESEKTAYVLRYRDCVIEENMDSFASNAFIGEDTLVKSNFGNNLTFLLQIKHPNEEAWYRIYFDEDFYDFDCSSEVNGDILTIQKFTEKPKLNFLPEVDASRGTESPIRTACIRLKSLKQNATFDNFIEMETDKKHSVSKYSKSDWKEAAKKSPHYKVSKSHILGYPDWIQMPEIPDGFKLENFLLQLNSDEFGFSIGNRGRIYIFEKKGKFGITWQCY